MYAIVSVTGRAGSAIAENRLAQGEQVRAIVRNPEKAAHWKDCKLLSRGTATALRRFRSKGLTPSSSSRVRIGRLKAGWLR